MSNAFNLSQLANFVDSSGKVNLATGSTGTVPTTQGGTGLTTVGTNGQVLSSNGTTLSWTTPSSGGVTSLNGQTGAITNTDFGAIGSYGILSNAANSDISSGATVAGSNLRYNYSMNQNTNDYRLPGNPFRGMNSTDNNASYPGGGTALSGTWRRMPTSGPLYYQQTGSKGTVERSWGLGFFVRIS